MVSLILGKKTKEEVQKNLEKHVTDLSKQELKELLLVNTYKLALVRSQVEAIKDILIREKLTTFEEIWKKTNDSFKESKI